MDIKMKLAGLSLLLIAQQSDAAVITAFDQYMLELLNQFRAAPQAAANTYLSGNLNEGLAAGTITTTSKQPLAWDLSLVNAAQAHTQDMIANNFFAHQGSNGSSPFQRMTDAGYSFQTAGENLSTRGQTGLSSVTAAITAQMNVDLFVDAGVDGRGHRTNMMNGNFESVGISVGHSSSFSPLGNLPSNLVTLDFGANANGPFLTGVAYNDLDANNFYTPGEGLAGVSILAYHAGTTNLAGSTTSLDAGGYALNLGNGAYDLQINGTLGQMFVPGIVLSGQNVKLDYTAATVPLPAATWLFGSTLIGMVGMRRRLAK